MFSVNDCFVDSTVTKSYFNFCHATRRSGAHFTQDSTPKVLMPGWALWVDRSPARGDVNYFFARQRTLSCQCEAHKQIPKRLQQSLRRVRSNRCLSEWTHTRHLLSELRWYHVDPYLSLPALAIHHFSRAFCCHGCLTRELWDSHGSVCFADCSHYAHYIHTHTNMVWDSPEPALCVVYLAVSSLRFQIS